MIRLIGGKLPSNTSGGVMQGFGRRIFWRCGLAAIASLICVLSFNLVSNAQQSGAGTADGAGWTVLFRGDDPAISNTNSGDRSLKNGFAVGTSIAPKDIQFLKMTRMDTGDSVIIPMDHDKIIHDHAILLNNETWWQGGRGAPGGPNSPFEMLGIARADWPAEHTDQQMLVCAKGRSDIGFRGWGFSVPAKSSNADQCYSWDGVEIKKTVFEISVKSGDLTAKELTQIAFAKSPAVSAPNANLPAPGAARPVPAPVPGAAPFPAAAPFAVNSPTPEEAHRLANSGQYDDALRMIARVMAKSDDGYDRHDLLMLRAECYLQTRNAASALTTLNTVYQEADAAHNAEDIDGALAMAFLIQKSPAFKYTPKSGKDRKPIDIVSPAWRKIAYAAVYTDELSAFKQEGRDARSQMTIAPLLDIAKRFACVQGLEDKATGGKKQTDAMARDLSDWASKMINVTLDGYKSKVDTIDYDSDHSNHHTQVAASDLQVLQDIVVTCNQVPDAVATLTRAYAQPGDLSATVTKAREIKDHATTVLNRNGK
jgi:hypothetical protein